MLVGTRPDVHNFVIALAVSHEAGTILILDFLDLCLSNRKDLFLVFGDNHVVHADRNTGHRRETEARVHQSVSKDHRLLEAQLAITRVDDVRNCFLRHRAVDMREFHAVRQDARQQGTTNCRVEDLRDFLNLASFIGLMHRYANLYLRL